MSVTRNLPRSAAVPRRRSAWHRTALASGALASVTLLSAGCGGHSVHVKHIQHAPGYSASQQAQTHAA